jgi:hypothetical protein
MSTLIDEQLERQIVRHLDGQLDGEQEARLYRALLRDPAARRVMDVFADADRRAASALRAAIHAPPRPMHIDQLPQRKPRRIPWAQLLATAAMIVVALGLWGVIRLADTPSSAGHDTLAHPDPAGQAVAPPELDSYGDLAVPQVAVAQPWWRSRPQPIHEGRLVDARAQGRLVDGLTSAQRTNDRALVGVLDQANQRLYWLEVNHSHTAVEPLAGEL